MCYVPTLVGIYNNVLLRDDPHYNYRPVREFCGSLLLKTMTISCDFESHFLGLMCFKKNYISPSKR